MKILHVISSLSPRSGGPTTVILTLAQEQARQGHDVVICATNADNPSGTLPVKTDRPLYYNGVTIWYFSIYYFFPLCISKTLIKWVNNNIRSFDIVHVHGLYRFPPTYSAWKSKSVGIPFIIRPHGNLDPFLMKQSRYCFPLKKIYEHLFDIPNLNHAAAIHYTSDEEAQQALPLGLSSKPMVMPNGIDWQSYKHLPSKGIFRHSIGITKRQKLVLFLGRINFKKGLDLLIPALGHVSKKIPDVHLAIVGPDNDHYLEKVRQWCKAQHIEANVSFVGYLDPDKAREAYIDANIFVLPSYSENFGMTVVEAMACGCPVIISDRVNIWKDVKKADAGLVVGLDSQELAGAITKMLTDMQSSQAMGLRGRQAAAMKYAWPPIVRQLTEAYCELIKTAQCPH